MPTINYHNKKFRAVTNSENGELSSDTIFTYKQKEQIISCFYEGESIIEGHILGKVMDDGSIEMVYHQINRAGEIRTGTCSSKPEIMSNGKIRLYETWQWTTGDCSIGNSILEEI